MVYFPVTKISGTLESAQEQWALRFPGRRFHTEAFIRRDFYTQTFLHKETFRHRRFYTQRLLHTDAFAHRHFYTQTLLHTDAFTDKRFLHTGAFFLHTEAFTHRRFYTQTLLHTDAFTQTLSTHRGFYTQALSHTDIFTHRPFHTQRFFFIQTNAFHTKALLHTDKSGRSKIAIYLSFWRSTLISCGRVAPAQVKPHFSSVFDDLLSFRAKRSLQGK